jgi:hypothetical protein
MWPVLSLDPPWLEQVGPWWRNMLPLIETVLSGLITSLPKKLHVVEPVAVTASGDARLAQATPLPITATSPIGRTTATAAFRSLFIRSPH